MASTNCRHGDIPVLQRQVTFYGMNMEASREVVFEFLEACGDGARLVVSGDIQDSPSPLFDFAGKLRLERCGDGLFMANLHPRDNYWWLGVLPDVRIGLGRFFPCSRTYRNACFRLGRYAIFWEGDRLVFCRMSLPRRFWRRMRFWLELVCDRRIGARKAAIVRLAVAVLRIFKHRPLWLVSDRLDAAGDNGEVLFRYLRKRHPSIDVRFVVSSRATAFRELGAIGSIVAAESPRRKMLTLLADCLISSQAERAFSNPFDGYSEPYRDLLHRIPVVFLQHGVTQNDLSSGLGRRIRNFAGFVVSAAQERDSVVNGSYGYDAEAVWLTGLPRFDMLTAATSVVEKRILVMPTWRLSLLDGQTGPNGEWRLKNGFQKSEFFRFYGGLLSDERLLDACRRHGYAISFVLHPNMLAAQSFFRSDDVVNVLNGNTPYGSLFLQGALLVTDYSSTAFDFAYLRKPVVYAQFDADSFFDGSHTYGKGYFNYVRDGFGEVECTLDATIDRIIAYMETGCAAKDKYVQRANEFFAFSDGENCRRVAERIFQLAGREQ